MATNQRFDRRSFLALTAASAATTMTQTANAASPVEPRVEGGRARYNV